MTTIELMPGLNGYQQCLWLAAKSAIHQAAAAMISITDTPLGQPGADSVQQDPVTVAQSLAEFEKALEDGLTGFHSTVTDTPLYVGVSTDAFAFRSVPKMVFCSRNASNALPSGES